MKNTFIEIVLIILNCGLIFQQLLSHMPKWHRNISCSYRNNSCGDKGNRVKGYLIASSHCTVKVPGKKKRQKILKHPDVKTWLQGLPMSNPELISIIPWWDLQVVLSALKQLPYYPSVKPPLSPYPQSHDPCGTDFGKTGILIGLCLVQGHHSDWPNGFAFLRWHLHPKGGWHWTSFQCLSGTQIKTCISSVLQLSWLSTGNTVGRQRHHSTFPLLRS